MKAGERRRDARAQGRARPLARVFAAALAAWGLAMSALLVACGPGLGGTGTGASSDSLQTFGAQAAEVCQSDFADLLPCGGSGAAPAPSGASRWFAEAEPESRLLLELAGSEARLQLRCAMLEFNGVWGQAAGASPRYYGRISTAGTEAPGMLLVARSPEGLRLQLLDREGQPLYGDLSLHPVASATSAAPCP